jgi:predicted aminopeptidase
VRLRPPTFRQLGRVAGAFATGIALFLALTPTGRYLARAGWEEGKILRARRPIARLVLDTANVTPMVRGKLALVLAARQFAVDSIGLRVDQSFTQFTQLERDTLVLLLSGAHRDRLATFSWWFPVVGRVPYKGYFDYDAARAAARRLRDRGLDVTLRPASAFSTLGYFNDPLLSTTLALDSVSLANTVIHEVTHSTFYAPGQAVFNESFANFVGARGSAWLFRARGQPAAVAEAERDWQNDRVLSTFWTDVYNELDSAFKAHPGSRDARQRPREGVYARARARLRAEVAPRLTNIPPNWADRVPLNNSALLSRRVYLTDLGLFDAVHEREGRDLRRTIARVVALAKARPDAPYAALREWVGRGTGEP